MSLHPCFRRRWLLQVCHVFVDISVILWLCTRILPRLAQGVFSNEKELDRTTEAIVPMNMMKKGGESWMPTCTNMCHSVPTWANIAVCQLYRERQAFWNTHDGLNLTCLDQCHGVPWRTPKNCDKVYSLNLIDPCFRRRWLLQVCLGKAFPMPLWTSVLFCGCAAGFSQG